MEVLFVGCSLAESYKSSRALQLYRSHVCVTHIACSTETCFWDQSFSGRIFKLWRVDFWWSGHQGSLRFPPRHASQYAMINSERRHSVYFPELCPVIGPLATKWVLSQEWPRTVHNQCLIGHVEFWAVNYLHLAVVYFHLKHSVQRRCGRFSLLVIKSLSNSSE